MDVAFPKIEFVSERKMFVAVTLKSPVCKMVLQMDLAWDSGNLI